MEPIWLYLTSAINNNASVRLVAGGVTNVSPTFAMQAGAVTNVDVIIGGSTSLTEVASLNTSIEVVPAEGNLARIVRTSETNVLEDRIVAGVLAGQLHRGGVGEVQWNLYNQTDVEIELITATSFSVFRAFRGLSSSG